MTLNLESNSIFSAEELKKIAGQLEIMVGNLNYHERLIETEEDFDLLYKKSRGCVGEDDWVLFFSEHTGDKTKGSLYKLSTEGVLMLAKKFKVDLK